MVQAVTAVVLVCLYLVRLQLQLVQAVLAHQHWLLVLKAVTQSYRLSQLQEAVVVVPMVELVQLQVVLVVVLARVHYLARVTKAVILR